MKGVRIGQPGIILVAGGLPSDGEGATIQGNSLGLGEQVGVCIQLHVFQLCKLGRLFKLCIFQLPHLPNGDEMASTPQGC